MDYASKSVVVAQRLADAWLAALSTRPAATLLATPMLRLSKNPGLTLTPQSTKAALAANEADFSGYAAVAVVFVAPTNLGPQAQGAVMATIFLRTLGTPDVGETVYGWWIDDTVDFAAGEVFQGGGIPLGLPGDFLSLTIAIPVALLPAFINA